jgi:hypothetical protein
MEIGEMVKSTAMADILLLMRITMMGNSSTAIDSVEENTFGLMAAYTKANGSEIK